MTDQELKDLVASLAVQSKKTDAQLAKTDAQIAKTEVQMAKSFAEMKEQSAKTDAQLAKTDAQFKKEMAELKEQVAKTSLEVANTTREVANTTRNVNGIAKTNGLDAEEFFYSSLKSKKQLDDIKFDDIDKNVKAKKKGRTHEVDIFLENGTVIGLVEVKNKVRPKDLEQLQNIVKSFYEFYPDFKDYKLIPAIAGKVFPKNLQDEAIQQGFVVLTQKGNHMEQRV